MSCVIVSVCSALLVAMNHISHAVYIYNSRSARARVLYVYAHACPRYVCTCIRVCVYNVCCVRVYIYIYVYKSLRLYTVYLSRCAYVLYAWRVTQFTHTHTYVSYVYVCACARTHDGNRARRGAMDSKRNGAVLLEWAPLASITCHTAPYCAVSSIFFFFFFRLIGLRAFAWNASTKLSSCFLLFTLRFAHNKDACAHLFAFFSYCFTPVWSFELLFYTQIHRWNKRERFKYS